MQTNRECNRYNDPPTARLQHSTIYCVLKIVSFSLKIKGSNGEDAVLCTANKTFSVRTVALSNSVLIVTPPPDSSSIDFADDAVVISDQVTEILELTPAVPKLHTLSTILRGKDYDDDQDDDENSEGQALRPIAPAYLDHLLELILNVLIALSLSHQSVSVEALSSSLADDHEVPRSISTQVMSWFGNIKDGKWKMDVNTLLKEVGLGVLRHHLHEPIMKGELIAKWKSLVGDTFKANVDLDLLSGNYLASPNDPESLTYFPASALPVDAARRFADLFLTRPRWKAENISPFLADIAVDSKERDKLLLKFARATTGADGVWYTARTQYSG
ncbi:hypothetical protein H0H87_009661 [Tephrocybe sp. NHM501043]|nr:hypothetical protein H0H87_009661 [Tephrocybe sp. NHM501043]